jgi:hypothetical protein
MTIQGVVSYHIITRRHNPEDHDFFVAKVYLEDKGKAKVKFSLCFN